MWINAQTLATYSYVYEIRQAFPDVSFPEYPTDSDFETVGVYPVKPTQQPAYNPITQNLVEETPQYVDGEWVQVWTVEPATPEEIALREEAAKQENKNQASNLLSATDWVELGDVANPASPPFLANKADFTAYRQQLRAIAVNPPVTVEPWPVKPEEIWSV